MGSPSQLVREDNDALDRCIDLEPCNDTYYEQLQSDAEFKRTVETSGVNDDKTSLPFKPRCSSDDSAQPYDNAHNIGNDKNLAEEFPRPDVSINQAANKIAQIPATEDSIEAYGLLDNEYYPGVTAQEKEGNETIVYDDGVVRTQVSTMKHGVKLLVLTSCPFVPCSFEFKVHPLM